METEEGFDESDVSDETVEMDEDDDDPDHNNDACRLYKSQVFPRLIDSLLREMKNRYDVVRSLDANSASCGSTCP